MRGLRGWVPVLGWCAATLASIGVATVALQPVLRAANPAGATPPLDRPPAAAGPTNPLPELTATPPVTSPSVTRAVPPSSTPSGAAPARTTGTPAAPTTAPAATVVDGWTVTTGADGQPVYLRSFRVDGGQAVIRMSAGRVQLVSATPNPGYSVDTVQNEPGNLAVQFTEPDHYFVIHAIWHNGPFAQVSEVGS